MLQIVSRPCILCHLRGVCLRIGAVWRDDMIFSPRAITDLRLEKTLDLEDGWSMDCGPPRRVCVTGPQPLQREPLRVPA